MTGNAVRTEHDREEPARPSDRSNIRVQNLRPQRRPPDLPMLAAGMAMWLVVASFGTVLWAINGGFSVYGLEQLCLRFNDAGRLFWQAAERITVEVPFLQIRIPILPWLGVIAATILQIVALYLTLIGRDIPGWLFGATLAISAYDYGSTYAGFEAVAWIAATHWLVRALLAILLVFLVELIIASLLAMHVRQRRS
jgi:hypothetical protein